MSTEKEYVVGDHYVSLLLLTDGVQVSYIVTEFLSGCSLRVEHYNFQTLFLFHVCVVLLLDGYTFRFVVPYRLINPFIIIKCTSLRIFIFLKSIFF